MLKWTTFRAENGLTTWRNIQQGSEAVLSERGEEWETVLDEFADSPAFNKAASFVNDSHAEFYCEREDSQLSGIRQKAVLFWYHMNIRKIPD